MNSDYDSQYHRPVMLEECIEGLAIKPDGVYVDVTFGGGGHSRAILDALGPEGVLIAFDQDPFAQKNIPDDARIKFVPQNFEFLQEYIRFLGFDKVDGLLADFGVSSFQFDEGERGFSLRFDGPLDMRMNPNKGQSALEFISSTTWQELSNVLRTFGEIQNPKNIAIAMKQAAEDGLINTTNGLVHFLQDKKLVPFKGQKQFLAQIFQALRMEVNREVEVIEKMLASLDKVIAPEGRIVFLSYHSLEDRLVKNYLKTGNVQGEVVKDFYGNLQRSFKPLHSKPVMASAEEIEHNPRSRSAKLRRGVRL